MNDVILIGQTDPFVQGMLVIYVAYKGLTLLGQHQPQHVYWAAELGLPLFKVLLVLPVTLNLGRMEGPHYLGVVLNVSGPNVVAKLFPVAFLVFVLKKKKGYESNAKNISFLSYFIVLYIHYSFDFSYH